MSEFSKASKLASSIKEQLDAAYVSYLTLNSNAEEETTTLAQWEQNLESLLALLGKLNESVRPIASSYYNKIGSEDPISGAPRFGTAMVSKIHNLVASVNDIDSRLKELCETYSKAIEDIKLKICKDTPPVQCHTDIIEPLNFTDNSVESQSVDFIQESSDSLDSLEILHQKAEYIRERKLQRLQGLRQQALKVL